MRISFAAFADEYSKIAAAMMKPFTGKLMSPMAQGHVATLKAMGGVRKAKGVEAGLRAAMPKPVSAAPKLKLTA